MNIKIILSCTILSFPCYATEGTLTELKLPKSSTYFHICEADSCIQLAAINTSGASSFNWAIIQQMAEKYVPGKYNEEWITVAKLLWDARQQTLNEIKLQYYGK